MTLETKITLALLILLYVLLNLYVTKRINKADYLQEDRRSLHKKFIWVLPFLGPLAIRGFWRKKKEEGLEVMTKDKRKSGKSNMSDNWQDTTGFGG